MASDEALEAFALRREGSAEVTLSESFGDSKDCESRSGDSEDSETASDDSEHLKVATAAVAARITVDFGTSGVMKTQIVLMENYTRYFPNGYC
jgi:hypothetical protein